MSTGGMTHRVYGSVNVDARLVVRKRRPHGRQCNVRRCWKLRDVTYVLPGAFGSDDSTRTRSEFGRLRTIR